MGRSPDEASGVDDLRMASRPAMRTTRIRSYRADVPSAEELDVRRSRVKADGKVVLIKQCDSRCSGTSAERFVDRLGATPQGAVDTRFGSSALPRPLPTRLKVEELWLTIGEDDGGFGIERVAVREFHDFSLHMDASLQVDEEKIGVLIVDSNDQMRAGIRDLISGAEHVEVLGEAGNYHEAIQLAFRLSPSVVLIDPGTTDEGDIEAVQIIKRQLPRANVMLLTAHEDVDYLMEAVAAGAVGYIVKGTKRSDLLSAIQAAASGVAVIDRAMLPGLVRRISGKQPTPKVLPEYGRHHLAKHERDNLTKREQEVLNLIADGLTNKEISERLCVTIDTVKSHVHRIIQKLQVSDRTSAAVQALRKELRR